MRTTDAAIKAAQLAHDLRDDEPRRCKTCALDEAKPCRHDPECPRWERCSRCEREPAEMERGGKRVCVECAWEIDHEEDDREEDDERAASIGRCSICGAEIYTAEGFCGGCDPLR